MKKRITITGPSSVGKTTLANWISDKYKLPFVNGSYSAAVPETEKMKHIDMMKQPIGVIQSQDMQVVRYRKNEFKKCISENTGFVCDRSYVDSAAYWLHKISGQVCSTDTEIFIKSCFSLLMSQTDHLIYIPFKLEQTKGDNPFNIEDNKKRVLSAYFQWHISNIIKNVLDHLISLSMHEQTFDGYLYHFDHISKDKHHLRILTLETTDFSKRQELVEEFIK